MTPASDVAELALPPSSTARALPGRNPFYLWPGEQSCCPACGGRALQDVLTLPRVPTNSCLMLDTPEEARAFPRGDIVLAFCGGCGFVFNRAFDPRLTEYSGRYEPTQAYSPTFRRFHQALAHRLAEQVGAGLAGGTVVEVGCGQGEFLHLFCAEAGCRGVGYDPCLSEERADVLRGQRADAVQLVPDFFSDASVNGLAADMLVSKMTLEHIPAAGRFAGLVEAVARASRPGMRLFIQVPESERIFRDCAFEDVYYEHCNYFTAASLVSLFARHGFVVEELTREYDDQYLAIRGHHDPAAAAGSGVATAELERLRGMAGRFAADCAGRMAEWRRIVEARRAADRPVVVWGSGSKGVTFLGALGEAGAASVSHVVDINPHRQGHYMVGSGHPIVGPEALREIQPGTVIVMNPIYRQEVAELLAGLGLTPELLTL